MGDQLDGGCAVGSGGENARRVRRKALRSGFENVAAIRDLGHGYVGPVVPCIGCRMGITVRHSVLGPCRDRSFGGVALDPVGRLRAPTRRAGRVLPVCCGVWCAA